MIAVGLKPFPQNPPNFFSLKAWGSAVAHPDAFLFGDQYSTRSPLRYNQGGRSPTADLLHRMRKAKLTISPPQDICAGSLLRSRSFRTNVGTIVRVEVSWRRKS
jgi:hypothetical protein